MSEEITITDLEGLQKHLLCKQKGQLMIAYQNCENYEGVVLALMILFDTIKKDYRLDLQWASFGLDLYGDTLQESYIYQFESLQVLMDYLDQKYQIKASEIKIPFKYDAYAFPSPITHADKKSVFEEAWSRFSLDFKNGELLDPSLHSTYSSLASEG